MPIQFIVVERGNPARPDAPKKYYPSIRARGRMTLRQLAEKAADMSTLTTVDVLAVIESLLAIIPQELENGRIVDLGDFGNFWLRSTSEGSTKPEQVRGDKITSLIPRFMPGKRFKQALDQARFEKTS
jgi:predicted histone-like DNA-binding protein